MHKLAWPACKDGMSLRSLCFQGESSIDSEDGQGQIHDDEIVR